MKIRLKNVKHSSSLSQETSAYSATVYIDDVQCGTVTNHGTGGPDIINPRALEDRLNEYGKTLPPLIEYGMSLTQDAGILLGHALDFALAEKKLVRLMKTKTVFIENKKCYTGAGNVQGKPGRCILNTLPLDQAVEEFLKHA